MPAFWGREITDSKVSPHHRKPDLTELSWEDISMPHGHTQNPANSGCVYCRDTAGGSHHRPAARKPGALSSGPSKPTVLAFVSVPSPYGIRTCLWPLGCRLAHFWDSRQEDTDLREGRHTWPRAHFCVGRSSPGLSFAFHPETLQGT